MASLAKTAFFRLLCLVSFVSLGGLIFRAVERRDDNAKDEKENMLKSLEATMKSKYNMSEQDFQDFAKTAYNAQIPTGPDEWTFQHSIFFAVTIVTTIGYGSLTPTTPLGQILVIFYAILGIPLALLTLNSIGGLISYGACRLICALEKRFFQIAEPRETEVKGCALTFLLTLIILLTGSCAAVNLVEWSFLEAFYFWFVTFTTIGFGDYVLYNEMQHHGVMAKIQPLVALLAFILTMFGLAAVASVVNSLVDVAAKKWPCRPTPRIDDSHEQGEETHHQVDAEKNTEGSLDASAANVTYNDEHA